MTKTQQIINYLKSKGFIEFESPSKKYRKFKPYPSSAFCDQFYWVGTGASVRRGRTVSSSISVTSFYRKLIK